jgi:hypothetical protein
MQLRRLLGKHQRGGDEQVAQGTVHGTVSVTGNIGRKSTTTPLKEF